MRYSKNLKKYSSSHSALQYILATPTRCKGCCIWQNHNYTCRRDSSPASQSTRSTTPLTTRARHSLVHLRDPSFQTSTVGCVAGSTCFTLLVSVGLGGDFTLFTTYVLHTERKKSRERGRRGPCYRRRSSEEGQRIILYVDWEYLQGLNGRARRDSYIPFQYERDCQGVIVRTGGLHTTPIETYLG